MSDTTIEDVEANVEAQTTETDACMALVNGIETLVAEALYSEPISPAGNGKLKRIFAGLKSKKDEIGAAVIANTPSAKTGAGVTAIKVTADANPATAGKPVLLTAMLTQGAPVPQGATAPANPAAGNPNVAPQPVPATGSVKFMDGAGEIGSDTLDKTGKATASQTFIAGTYAITAVYSGDAANAPATSSVLTLTVA
jgi:hypothetical protein